MSAQNIVHTCEIIRFDPKKLRKSKRSVVKTKLLNPESSFTEESIIQHLTQISRMAPEKMHLVDAYLSAMVMSVRMHAEEGMAP